MDIQFVVAVPRFLLVDSSKQFQINRDVPPNDKTNKITCVPSEDSDQPGHPPSLFSICSALSG